MNPGYQQLYPGGPSQSSDHPMFYSKQPQAYQEDLEGPVRQTYTGSLPQMYQERPLPQAGQSVNPRGRASCSYMELNQLHQQQQQQGHQQQQQQQQQQHQQGQQQQQYPNLAPVDQPLQSERQQRQQQQQQGQQQGQQRYPNVVPLDQPLQSKRPEYYQPLPLPCQYQQRSYPAFLVQQHLDLFRNLPPRHTAPSCMYEQRSNTKSYQPPSCMYEQSPGYQPPTDQSSPGLYQHPTSRFPQDQSPHPHYNRPTSTDDTDPTTDSDDDASGDEIEQPKPKLKGKIRSETGKVRVVYSQEATRILKAAFARNRYLKYDKNSSQAEELSKQTGLSSRRIKYWFQNERAKKKTNPLPTGQ